MFLSVKIRPRMLISLLAVIAVFFAVPYFSRAAVPASAAPAPRVAYLTFDDGPSRYTEGVLEALARHGVPATFFVTGQSEEYFPFIARAASEGHMIALHTYSHDFSEIYASSEAFWGDIDKLQALIVEQTGSPATAIRFAGGSSNTICRRYSGRGLMKALCDECYARGLVYHDWNVDTKDAESGVRSAGSIAERAVKGSLKQEYAVILMHDGTLAQNAAEALDIIIPALKEAGYSFERLDALDMPVHHSLA